MPNHPERISSVPSLNSHPSNQGLTLSERMSEREKDRERKNERMTKINK